ncbi:MAG: hypothetical protein JXR14_01590 [Paracoccaceae bacterium]
MGSVWLSLLIGILVGNLVGGVLKQFNLGVFANSVTGILGGVAAKQGMALLADGDGFGIALQTGACVLGAGLAVVGLGVIWNRSAR